MAACEVCENECDKAFEIVVGGERLTFDSFECAIPRAGTSNSYMASKAQFQNGNQFDAA